MAVADDLNYHRIAAEQGFHELAIDETPIVAVLLVAVQHAAIIVDVRRVPVVLAVQRINHHLHATTVG